MSYNVRAGVPDTLLMQIVKGVKESTWETENFQSKRRV